MADSWAAGLFDGEGCVNLGWQTHGGVCYRLTLEMKHRQTVRLFAEVIGGYVRVTARGTYVCQVAGSDAVQAAELLYPHAVTKRADLKRLLQLAALVQTRPKGVPTPPWLRKQYERLIVANRK